MYTRCIKKAFRKFLKAFLVHFYWLIKAANKLPSPPRAILRCKRESKRMRYCTFFVNMDTASVSLNFSNNLMYLSIQ